MSFSSMLRQLKKRLRIKRRWLSLGIVFLLAGIAVLSSTARHNAPAAPQGQHSALTMAGLAADPYRMPADEEEQQQVLKEIQGGGQSRPATFKKLYVCGEETIKPGPVDPSDLVRYHEEHPDAVFELDEAGEVTITEQVDDLSPACKENAYFGLDKSGNLSLFEDVPEKEQVIRTFFQLNIDRMKSSLPSDMVDQLYKGIRVSDLAEYNSVLSTFGEFASAEPDAEEQAAIASQQ